MLFAHAVCTTARIKCARVPREIDSAKRLELATLRYYINPPPSLSPSPLPLSSLAVKRRKALCLALFRTSASSEAEQPPNGNFRVIDGDVSSRVAFSVHPIRCEPRAGSVATSDSSAEYGRVSPWNNFPARWIDASREVSRREGQIDGSEHTRRRRFEGVGR